MTTIDRLDDARSHILEAIVLLRELLRDEPEAANTYRMEINQLDEIYGDIDAMIERRLTVDAEYATA